MIDLKKDKPITPSRLGAIDYLEPWKELVYKNSKKNLTERAGKIAYSLVYRSWFLSDQVSSLQADLHNLKKSDSAYRFLLIWKKLKINSTKEFVDFLSKKWTAIYERESN